MELWAALSLAITYGFITSFHCIGMCGPIALALPLRQQTWFSRVTAALLYNIGRAITYATLGAIFGLFGMGLKLVSFHFQQGVSIAFGVLMILSVLFPALFRNVGTPAFLKRPLDRLKGSLARRFSNPSYLSLFTIGLLNGLLPCGPVYIAIAAALASSSVLDGALYMFVFGLGTMPTMLALSLAGNLVSLSFRKAIRKVVPFVVVLIGTLFILRGMNLGIPMVSPKIEKKQEKVELECCKGKNNVQDAGHDEEHGEHL